MNVTLLTWTSLLIVPIAFVVALCTIYTINRWRPNHSLSFSDPARRTEQHFAEVKQIASPHLDFEIDTSAFRDPIPMFAYVDDLDCHVESLNGMELAGEITIFDQPNFMWLSGPRKCVLLKANPNSKTVSFRSFGAGEFCLEIYHLPASSAPRLIFKDDFCCK